MSSILDEDVTSFELNASFFPSNKMNTSAKPRLIGPTTLLSTIAKRCPKLESLTISSYYPNLNWDYINSLRFNYMFAIYLPIFSLKVILKIETNLSLVYIYIFCIMRQNLLKLELLATELKYLNSELLFLSLGESCPTLKYLKMGRNLWLSGAKDAIALFLGKKASLFADNWINCKVNELHHIQVADEHVAPFCHSLEHLEIGLEYDHFDAKRISLVAFILRHLPRLQTWAVSEMNSNREYLRTSYIFDAIHLLYKYGRVELPNKRKFSVQELDNGGSIEWTINTPPPSIQLCFISCFFFRSNLLFIIIFDCSET